ncbi:hypothetical protein ACOME3_008077 [Neoechinorhynchus agilis]
MSLDDIFIKESDSVWSTFIEFDLIYKVKIHFEGIETNLGTDGLQRCGLANLIRSCFDRKTDKFQVVTQNGLCVEFMGSEPWVLGELLYSLPCKELHFIVKPTSTCEDEVLNDATHSVRIIQNSEDFMKYEYLESTFCLQNRESWSNASTNELGENDVQEDKEEVTLSSHVRPEDYKSDLRRLYCVIERGKDMPTMDAQPKNRPATFYLDSEN